jgi:hypothetical protein
MTFGTVTSVFWNGNFRNRKTTFVDRDYDLEKGLWHWGQFVRDDCADDSLEEPAPVNQDHAGSSPGTLRATNKPTISMPRYAAGKATA